MSVIFVPYQECPRCDCAIKPDNYTREYRRRRTEAVDRIYCEHCDMGWEQTCDVVGGSVVPDPASRQSYVARTEPIEFGKFLQRLNQQKVVAA